MILVAAASVMAQSSDLFMARNIRRAFDKGTRSADGNPGARYWQNKAIYKINAQVNTEKRILSGKVDVTYINNSPDSLRILRFKIAHDLWKKGAQRGYDLNPDDILEKGVEIGGIKVNGVAVAEKSSNRYSTFLDISLQNALAPSAQVSVEMDWSYRAPMAQGTPRECVCQPGTWFVAYWFPQIAVYDDVHGWAEAPYNGLQEMYNDFSDYEVHIDVPGNTMVWATGEWQNAPDLLQPEFLSRYKSAFKSNSPVKIFTPEDYAAKKEFFKKEGTHTFVYTAFQVPDFAFALSDSYLWDAQTVTVDDANGRKTLVAAAYNPASQDYYTVCDVASKAIRLMSTYQPGYPYPYPAMTVFNGDDGMEFPMMCNDASTHPRSPVSLTCHEISHTYFPFMMGINEQYYAWMDEGWASFFDVLLTDSLDASQKPGIRNYHESAGTEADMPPMVPARFLSAPAYRVASYTRPQSAYFNLLDMLGYERFNHCMRTYMDRWKGKHPIPFDFFNSWNSASGENLDWYWKPWFFEWGYPDLAIQSVAANGNITVENKGTLPLAVHLTIEYTDGTTQVQHKTAAVWKNGDKTVIFPGVSGKKVKKVTLGDRFITDSYPENNVYTL